MDLFRRIALAIGFPAQAINFLQCRSTVSHSRQELGIKPEGQERVPAARQVRTKIGEVRDELGEVRILSRCRLLFLEGLEHHAEMGGYVVKCLEDQAVPAGL